MPLQINLRHLEHRDLNLEGEILPTELDLDQIDDLIHVRSPLAYRLAAERQGRNILVHGTLRLRLDCECVRCLKPFEHLLELGEWGCLLPLDGEDKVLPVNDCVDLTPYMREDILLAFPRHPLCEIECPGLPSGLSTKANQSSGASQTDVVSSAWAELNKLKL